VELRLLGTVEVETGGRRLALGPRKQRLVLAVLALEVNRPVSVDRLVELAWPVDPPRTAEHAIRVCVSGLRAVFSVAGVTADEAELRTHGNGYLLRTDPRRIDVHRFRALLAQAREAVTDEARLGSLNEALDLWSGSPLAGVVPTESRHQLCAGLEEAYLVAVEDRLDARLRLGHHHELLDELTGLVAAHPLRERPVAQLMLALYRAGQVSEALAAFQRGRERLADQLGLDPGAELQRLHQAILRRDPELRPPGAADTDARPAGARAPAAGPAHTPDPAQLPPAVAGFTGRAAALAELDALLEASTQGPSVAIAAIGGTAGVGKTALAVRWASQRRHRFPDGQLYVNLAGYTAGAAPMRPDQALARFLRALGVPPEEVPLDEDEASARYRSLLADRRVLVVLDNARGPDQVRPLLPAGAGCLVVVTSRDRLTGLAARDGARLLTLGVLDAGEADALLATLVGADRVAAEPAAAAELAALCGYLPLALRIAGANLAAHPHRTFAEHVVELRAGNRLALLQVHGDDESAVRASFDLSYAALKPEARRMFRLIGLVPGADFTAPAAAALTDSDITEARDTLGQLLGAHLLDEPAAGRYALHDLLRLYARGLAEIEDGVPERAAALRRLGDFYLSSVDNAAHVLYPQMQRLPLDPPSAPTAITVTDHAAALAWLEEERPNLVAMVRHAAAEGPRPVAWLLADALRGYFWMRRHADDWLAVGEAGLAAAVAADDAYGQAAAHLCLAQANRWLTRHERAVDHFAQARTQARRAGWPQGEAAALGSIANTYRDQGRLSDSADHHRQALDIFRRTGSLGGQAVSLGNLGNVLLESGRVTEAIDHLTQGLHAYEQIGAQNGRAHMLNSLGCAYHALGRLDDALTHLDRALALHRDAGSREGEADTLNNLGQVHCAAGRYDEAMRLAEASIAMAGEAGDRRVEADAHNTLGVVHRAAGDLHRASEDHQVALRLARETGYGRGRAEALIGLAEALRGLGRTEEARAAAMDALAVTQRAGFRMLETDARAALAAVDLTDETARPTTAQASEGDR
jgi:DNA-binding SARP family transcriptional activator/tetratricopeptide (TPR) repeat protein